MGDIIEFRPNTNKFDKKVYDCFLKIAKKYNYARNFCDPNKDDSDKELDFLFMRLSILINNHKNKNWKTDKVEERYISLVNDLESISKKNKKMKVNIVFDQFMLTYLFDIYPKLAYENPNFIMKVVDGFDSFMRISVEKDDKKNINILNILLNSKINSIINKNDSNSNTVADIICKIEEGLDLSEIISYFDKTEIDNEEISLDSGIITIDKIREYYENQANQLFSLMNGTNSLEQELKPFNIYRNLGYLYAINNFNEEYKIYFIDMVNDFRKKRGALIDQLKFVATVSEVYKYYAKDITKISYNNLRSLIYLKLINGISMEEVDEIRKGINAEDNRKL